MRQLEGGRLEAHVAAGRDLQDEPKVNVHQVPRDINQDVAVVAVLRLQQEARNGVPARQITLTPSGSNVEAMWRQKACYSRSERLTMKTEVHFHAHN